VTSVAAVPDDAHPGPAGARALPLVIHAAVLLAAIGCWIAALSATDLDDIAGLGLLDALPVTYYLAVALLAAGFAATVSGRVVRVGLAFTYILALVVVLHATTAVLYDEPRYVWVYKHLGVIDLIAQDGAAPRSLDIYANWPAFFALNAWFSRASGVSAMDYAPWAQVFFNVANVAALAYVLRGLTADRRLICMGAWFFVLANWIGQDFLAPQAFAFLMALGLAGLYLRHAPPPRAPATRPGRWLAGVQERIGSRLTSGAPPPPPVELPAPRAPRMALVLGFALFTAATMSHQLSPVIITASALALAIFVRRLPLWVPGVMIAIEALWLIPAWSYINDRYDLLALNILDRPRPVGSDPDLALPGVDLVARGAQLTVLLIGVLAIIGLVRRLRGGHRDIEAVLLILAPVAVTPLQGYGGEAPLRGFLFALPWLAFLTACACLPGVRTSRVLRPARLLVASVAVGTCLLFAYFGLEKVNRVPSDDVAAAKWIEANAPDGTLVTYIAPSFPARATAGYARLKLNTSPTTPNLLEDGDAGGRLWGEREAESLDSLLQANPAPEHYVVISRAQQDYLELYGFAAPGSVEALTAAINASGKYQLVHRRGDALVYRWTG
jgi:hypothetical protein